MNVLSFGVIIGIIKTIKNTKVVHMHSIKNHEVFLYVTNVDIMILWQIFDSLLYDKNRMRNILELTTWNGSQESYNVDH